jgi:hypothetical protein
MSVYLYRNVFVQLSVHMYVYLYWNVSVQLLPVYPSFCLSISIPIGTFVYLPVYLCVCLFFHRPPHLPIRLSFAHPSVCLSVCPSSRQSPSLSVRTSGSITCTTDLLFDWFGISYLTTDNFCFYWQNRPIQTSETGGQWYSDTSPFSIPWSDIPSVTEARCNVDSALTIDQITEHYDD